MPNKDYTPVQCPFCLGNLIVHHPITSGIEYAHFNQASCDKCEFASAIYADRGFLIDMISKRPEEKRLSEEIEFLERRLEEFI